MATHPIRGLDLKEHEFKVPLDHSRSESEEITVFVREVASPDSAEAPPLLFLQGGPGHESPRPTLSNPPWLRRALKDFRVFFLDQRGTGRSTPIEASDAVDPASLGSRLTHFRADAIVDDAECIRRALGFEQWSLLGQSFGGFVALCYLSRHPESIREAMFTGGLPPVGHEIDQIYEATFAAMERKSKAFFRRFPSARVGLDRALQACTAGDVVLPSGELLSARRLLTIGHLLGFSGGEQIHYLLERAPTSASFAHDIAALLPFDGRNPLYAVLHESCYADGGATRWAAERVRPPLHEDTDEITFTGEHLFRWHFDEEPGLRPFRDTALVLAEHEWPRLYDPGVLSRCEVPCAASIYGDDPFVIREFSEETGRLIPTMRPWLTNEYEHGGLRASGDRVFDRLLNLVRDRVD